MNCPKHLETILRSRLTGMFPEVLKPGKSAFDPDGIEADPEALDEKALEYDTGAVLDMVIKNAVLFGRQEDPVAIGISGNVITRVGPLEELGPLVSENTVQVDASGGSVLPGFTDSHLHLSVAMERLRGGKLSDVTTPGQLKSEIRRFASENSDEPVLYFFDLHYADPPVIPAERCRSLLDEIEDERPVLVFAHDLHTVWANTRALEVSGLFRTMPPYPPLAEELDLENKIVLGTDGKPGGEFREPEVAYFVSGPLGSRFPMPLEQKLECLEKVCYDLASHGITNVHNMALAQPAEDLSFLLLLLELEQKGRLPIRVCTSFSAIADDHMLEDVHRAYLVRKALSRARRKEMNAGDLHDLILEKLLKKTNTRHPSLLKYLEEAGEAVRHPKLKEILAHSEHIHKVIEDRYLRPHANRGNPHRKKGLPEHIAPACKLRCDTVKIFLDGIVEKGTAYRLDSDPSEGIPEFSSEDLDKLIGFADKLGMQVAAHSIGDASVKSMLDSIFDARERNREVDRERGHLIPHRVEHIELCRKEDIARFGKEGVVTSMQPLHEREPVTLWHKMVPREQWNTAFAWQGVLKNKAVLVFGSDWPIVSCDVREGIHHAVNRQPWLPGGAHQGVTLEQALEAYTSAPAFTEYSAGIKGKIAPGMLADIVILDGRIEDLRERDSAKTPVKMTICDGKIVYHACEI